MRQKGFVRLLLCGALVLGLGLLSARADDKKESTAVKPVARDKDKGWVMKHESFLAQAKKGGIDLLFLGDSITDAWGGEGHNPKSAGAEIFAKEFQPLKAANFGIGGDRTQHVLWRLQNGELDGIKPKVVMLMIGTNNSNNKDNTAEEIADGIKAIVAEIHKKSPQTKVLLLGVFPRGADPSAENVKNQREKLKAVNAIVAKLDDKGKTVKFLDIGDKFLEKDGTISKDVMPDYLHLSPKGYQIWADAVKGPIEELMKK
jgi:lysophospholipase L1-like esterase